MAFICLNSEPLTTYVNTKEEKKIIGGETDIKTFNDAIYQFVRQKPVKLSIKPRIYIFFSFFRLVGLLEPPKISITVCVNCNLYLFY